MEIHIASQNKNEIKWVLVNENKQCTKNKQQKIITKKWEAKIITIHCVQCVVSLARPSPMHRQNSLSNWNQICSFLSWINRMSKRSQAWVIEWRLCCATNVYTVIFWKMLHSTLKFLRFIGCIGVGLAKKTVILLMKSRAKWVCGDEWPIKCNAISLRFTEQINNSMKNWMKMNKNDSKRIWMQSSYEADRQPKERNQCLRSRKNQNQRDFSQTLKSLRFCCNFIC